MSDYCDGNGLCVKGFAPRTPDTSAKVDVEWVLQKFIQRADSEYCKGIHMATYDDDTRGWEARAKAGRYGEAEHKAHEKLNKHMGAHYTIYDVVKEVRAALQAPRSDTSAKVDVRLLNDAIALITKSLAAMLTDTSFASPYVEDHRPRVPSWVMTHFRHDHDRRVEYVNDIKQRLDWIRNATEKVRNEALQAPRSEIGRAHV